MSTCKGEGRAGLSSSRGADRGRARSGSAGRKEDGRTYAAVGDEELPQRVAVSCSLLANVLDAVVDQERKRPRRERIGNATEGLERGGRPTCGMAGRRRRA